MTLADLKVGDRFKFAKKAVKGIDCPCSCNSVDRPGCLWVVTEPAYHRDKVKFVRVSHVTKEKQCNRGNLAHWGHRPVEHEFYDVIKNRVEL